MRRVFSIYWPACALMATLTVATGGGAWAQEPIAAPHQADKPAETKKSEEAKPGEAKKPEEDKPFDEVVKDMQVLKGLFTFYLNPDENKLLMELLPEQLEKMYLFAGSTERGIGERGLYASMMGADFPFVFHRVGKNIQWIMKNTRFSAASGTPQARFSARSFSDAIVGSAKIQSKPHAERKSLLIDAAEVFVSDLPNFATALNQAFQPSSYRFDKPNSAVNGVRAFAENVLFEILLHYATDNPRVFSVALPDERSVPVVVKYELSTLKETGYKPRLVDDRVGFFHTVQQDFTSDRPGDPYVRYANRWQIEKSDPAATLSSPKHPIVFWLENTVPLEYREWVKEGALLYNKAFERIGFKDAIVVKQQPDDADWDPADTRYNTIRWFTGVDATFAIGPSRANPLTGQIYDADIGFSEGLTRVFRRQAEELVGPVSQQAMTVTPWNRNLRYQCAYAQGLVEQAAFGLSVLDARGPISAELENRFMREFFVSITAHEVGHTLGMRHNFRASTILKPNEIYDLKKTDELSQSSSVMDYNAVVIAPQGEKQGHFLPVTLGPYDLWAIEYAYKPIDGVEKAELAKIASRGADPMLPYSTDEDTLGTVTPWAMDPLANQFDQTNDPLAFSRRQIEIVDELWGAMESKLSKPGEGYQILRRAMQRGLGLYGQNLLIASKFIGGVYTHRDHIGDPNGRPPFVTVPAARQREALEFLRQYAFDEKAFELPSGLLNRLVTERQWGLDIWGYFFQPRLDYPWHDNVLGLQRSVLDRLFHPVTLARIQDNELRFPPGEQAFTMAEMFGGVSSAIWLELNDRAGKISSLRRNLQREHMKQLIRLALRQAPPPPPPPPPAGISVGFPPAPRPPEDATTLARANLLEIQAKVRKALAEGTVTEAITRAHLEETQARIAAVLAAQVEKPVE